MNVERAGSTNEPPFAYTQSCLKRMEMLFVMNRAVQSSSSAAF